MRTDILRLGQYVYAVSGRLILDKAQGAFLLTGREDLTAATERRLTAATETLRFATWYPTRGFPRPLAVVDYGHDHVVIGQPLWWRETIEEAQYHGAWRLTGGLFRPTILGLSGRGTKAGH